MICGTAKQVQRIKKIIKFIKHFYILNEKMPKSKNKSLFHEFLAYMWENKIWWMAPIIIMLLLVGILIIFAQSSAVSPFVYALF